MAVEVPELISTTKEQEPDEPVLRLSARACRKDGVVLTEAEIEEAEAEAEDWARRVNSCCGGEGL